MLFDFVMYFGLQAFTDLGNDPMVVIKESLCEEESEELLTIAVEGCCKLLLAKIVNDAVVRKVHACILL